MNFEDTYTLLIFLLLFVFFFFNKNIRVALINVIKSIFKAPIIITILIFITVFFTLDNFAINFFKTTFMSPFFFLASFITYIISFDDLYKNDVIRRKPIIEYTKSIFQISIISFYLDILFTMELNIFFMFMIAIICIILFVITNLTNKNDYPKKVSAGYDSLIALTNSLTFYIPFGIIVYHFNIVASFAPIFIISVLVAIFIDFITPVFNNHKIKHFAVLIKISYIIISVIAIPPSVLVSDILKPTITGNIAILVASITSLFMINIQTKIYKYKSRKK